MHYDAIVIGGSYSGMAASLQLLRARRSVLVIDAGLRRNRVARHSHGFLGQDGADPAQIAASARAQLQAYPTLAWLEGHAERLDGHADAFAVETGDGRSFQARRVLLATGVSDQLPAIPGLAERWGTHAFHCPYCHGYELDQGRIGVIATGPMSLHQAELLTDWGQVTLLANRAVEVGAEARDALQARGVVIEDVPIDRIEGAAEVALADGRVLPFAGLFVVTRTQPSGALAAMAGCALEDTPIGVQIHSDASGQTSVPGIFACGDATRVPHSVSLAVGNGAMVGAQLHRSLLWPGSMGLPGPEGRA